MRVMGVDEEEDCDTGLGLGMSIVAGEYHHSPPLQLDLLPFAPVPRDSASSQIFPPPKTLSDHGSAKNVVDVNKLPSGTHNGNMAASPTYSNVSSFHVDSNFIHQEAIASYGISRKRGRDHGVKEDFEMEKGCSKMSDEEEEGGGGARKKLRLSKDQSALLEESFKENSTLNTKQKQVLAKQLNLRPRQVEVWFQNRRARTKLKQTEVDCEFLKGCYESLTDENRRLQREIAELRAVKMATAASPMYMQLPRATLTMCPSCERVITSENSTGPLTSLQKPYVYPSYTHSSVAC